MLLGLVLFGLSTLYVKGRGNPVMLPDERARVMSYIFICVAAAALAGMIFIRSRLSIPADAKHLFLMYIIGYALAEGAALFGAVTWYIGGSRDWYIAGLVLMVTAFQVLPVRREA
jgi:FtsH-binding integral membrane protein